MNEHTFQIGAQYANRRGTYEVVAVDATSERMLIRYLRDGEEHQVALSIQARIWQNMTWEEQAEVQRRAEEDSRTQQGYGSQFNGLHPSDFKITTEGTTWRSRSGLAGAVARQLSDNTALTFMSWAIYRWPVAFFTHRADYAMAAFEMGSRKAKFTLEVDTQQLHYGFYIERNNGPLDNFWDWQRLVDALTTEPTLQHQIADAERAGTIRIIARSYRGEEHYHFANGLEKGARSLWREDGPPGTSVAERLQLLENVPQEEWIELYLIASTPKSEAVAAGERLAAQISATLRHLLPIYSAATGHRQ